MWVPQQCSTYSTTIFANMPNVWFKLLIGVWEKKTSDLVSDIWCEVVFEHPSLYSSGLYHHRHLQLPEVLPGSDAPGCEGPGWGCCVTSTTEGTLLFVSCSAVVIISCVNLLTYYSDLTQSVFCCDVIQKLKLQLCNILVSSVWGVLV